MTFRSIGAAVCLALALLPGPVPAAPSAIPRATTVPTPIVAKETLPQDRAADLYSARARRLVTGYLRLRLLELRAADLDRARAVIEGKLGPDALFTEPPARALR